MPPNCRREGCLMNFCLCTVLFQRGKYLKKTKFINTWSIITFQHCGRFITLLAQGLLIQIFLPPQNVHFFNQTFSDQHEGNIWIMTKCHSKSYFCFDIQFHIDVGCKQRTRFLNYKLHCREPYLCEQTGKLHQSY